MSLFIVLAWTVEAEHVAPPVPVTLPVLPHEVHFKAEIARTVRDTSLAWGTMYVCLASLIEQRSEHRLFPFFSLNNGNE
jgi:hypothetical protein